MTTGLERLEEAAQQFAECELDDLSACGLHDLIRRLQVVSTRLEAQLVRAVERWDATLAWADNGSRAPAARLARETGLPSSEAKRLVRRGRALRSMPLTEAGYRAGTLNGGHVDLIGSCDRHWNNASFADSEATLVQFCSTNVYGQAAEQVRMWQLYADRDVEHLDADRAARDAERNAVSASVSFQGRVFLDGNLDPLAGEIFTTELARLYEQLRVQDDRAGVERTPKQRRAAALVEMATRSATAPADGLRPAPLLVITTGVDHFAWLCHTAAGTIIEPELVMPYLADADIERIVYDPPNRRLEASHRRRFTGALRRVIELRDRHCQHPSGCDQPASRCDIDHIDPHSCGGITCVCNGQLLCRYHNRIVKADHDRRRALQHRVDIGGDRGGDRGAERHRTDCLLARPQPVENTTHLDDDHGIDPARLAKLFEHGFELVEVYRCRAA